MDLFDWNAGSLPTNHTVSSVFSLGRNRGHPEDLPLGTNDSVLFYVSAALLLQASSNRLGGLIPVQVAEKYEIVHVPVPAAVLDMILHAIYDMPLAQHIVTLETVALVTTTLRAWGIRPQTYIAPKKPLFILITSLAPLHPLETYILAASEDLYDLAVAASAYLLSVELSAISDEIATQIGAVYLNRLFKLHISRIEALKKFVLVPPHPHPETGSCGFIEQRKLARFWTMASAALAWDVRADTPSKNIETAFELPVDTDITCAECRLCLKNHVRNIIRQWTLLKRTI